MSDLEKSFRELSKTENVFMFVPNLIGYGRILLALLSFWFMPTNYVAAAWCYILSGQYRVYWAFYISHLTFKNCLFDPKYYNPTIVTEHHNNTSR